MCQAIKIIYISHFFTKNDQWKTRGCGLGPQGKPIKEGWSAGDISFLLTVTPLQNSDIEILIPRM